MARTVAIRLIGAFLLVYGLAAIVMGWWAYSVTHEAFTSVRSFTSAFERERNRALEALQGATGLLGGGSAEGSGSGGGPRVLQQADGLRERLRGILGGQDSNQSRGQQDSAPAPSQGGGLLDDLTRRLTQAQGSWSVLGEGPFRPGLLDQVELAVNAVLAWMALHGLASVVIGLLLLFRSPSAAPAAHPGAWQQPPPGGYPGPYYSRGPEPYSGYPPQAAPPPTGWREDPPTRPG